MSRSHIRRGALLAIGASIALASGPAAPGASGGLAVTRALRARLAATGRATAAVTVTLPDPLGGRARVERGRLALEPPDRLRLDFPASGERIAVRGEGGEWVQPATRQLVRIRREQAALAGWLWDVFLRGGADRFDELTVGGKTRLRSRDAKEGLPDLLVILDARGLPAQLEIVEPAGARYDFRGWRFSRPQGGRSFVLAPPAGYTVVDLP